MKTETLTDHVCLGWKRYAGIRQAFPCPYVGCDKGIAGFSFIVVQNEDGRRYRYVRAWERMKFAGTDTTYLTWM